MYQEYYEKLPDVDLYLKRIGMKRPTSLNKEYLDELVLAHQCSVPFENLDIYDLRKPISIIPRDIFEKDVGGRARAWWFHRRFDIEEILSAWMGNIYFVMWAMADRCLQGQLFWKMGQDKLLAERLFGSSEKMNLLGF